MSGYTLENPKLRAQMKETEEILVFGAKLLRAIEDSYTDKSITIMDLPNFIPVVASLMPAIDGVGDVVLEIKAANPEEIEALKAKVKEIIDLADEDFEVFTERVFAIALDIYSLTQLYNKIKERKVEDVPEDNGAMPEATA